MKILPEKIIRQKGFTLLETLVGISVLIVAITATFSAAQSGLSSSIESRDQIAAFYLAQEAVEMVRNVRDENSLERINNSAVYWLAGIAETPSDPCYFGSSCTVDAVTNTFSTCPSGPGSCGNLRQDTVATSPTYGMYGHDSTWSLTNFNREISLSQNTADELNVAVTVEWTKGGVTKSFRISEIIRDWL